MRKYKFLSNSKNNLDPFVRQNATPHDEQRKMSVMKGGHLVVSQHGPYVTVNSVILGNSPLQRADLMPHGIKVSIKFCDSFVRLRGFWSFFSLLLFPANIVMLDKFYFTGMTVENSILIGNMDNTKGWTIETKQLTVLTTKRSVSGKKGNIYWLSHVFEAFNSNRNLSNCLAENHMLNAFKLKWQ
jgi:hypothetical protein